MDNTYEKVKDRLPDGLMFLGYRGSHAHGMYLPNSNPNSIDDIDLMGVYVAPVEFYLGFDKKDTVESFIDEYDIVAYEFRKFVSLLAKNNPNVLSMLWLEPEHVLYQEAIWTCLVMNRHLFASKLAYHSFTGYAHAQLKKMTAFNQREQERTAKLRRGAELEGVVFDDSGVGHLPAGASTVSIEFLRQYNEVRSKYFFGYMREK